MGKGIPWKWVGVAVLAFTVAGIALLLPNKEQGSVTAKLIGQTNWNGQVYASLVVSNQTDCLHNFMAWGEHLSDGQRWERASAGGTISFPVSPEGTFRATVPIPSSGSRRLVLYCMRSQSNPGGLWHYWRATLRAILGRNRPSAYKMYVQVE